MDYNGLVIHKSRQFICCYSAAFAVIARLSTAANKKVPTMAVRFSTIHRL